MNDTKKYFNRELSWLSFNHRVLQEAADKTVPLFDRIKFLAIFSSNMDEFFSVRVATIRSVLKSSGNTNGQLKLLLKNIHKTVYKHQEEYGKIIKEITAELYEHKISLLNSENISDDQTTYINDYFDRHVRPLIQPILIIGNKLEVFLKNKVIYLAVRLSSNNLNGNVKSKTNRKINKYALVEIPTEKLPRFVVLPEHDKTKNVIFLDDVIKINLGIIFPGYSIEECYSVKLTRDAELYIEDEFSGDLLKKIKKSLTKRSTGLPSRFLYDSNMPNGFLKVLKKSMNFKKEDLIPGGKYHNLNDFFLFPTFGKKLLEYDKMTPLPCEDFDKAKKVIDVLMKKDVLLNYPYHSYEYVIRLLEESAVDPDVQSIKITLYRASSDSKIIKALINAAQNGKSVTAFVEVKARFDEDSNFKNAEELEKAGINVLYSFPGSKVHCKICLITRIEGNTKKHYYYLSTGNFNENTASIYSDFGFFSSNEKLALELKKIFRLLSNKIKNPRFKNILVAPFNLRDSFNANVDKEIKNVQNGKAAGIILKINSLEDKKFINKLYEASCAGVKITVIVRGICCLIPGIKGVSENIKIISIVDKYLEHARIYIFYNNGDEKIYLSSADLMTRNLNHRVEIAFPIYDPTIRKVINKIIEFQISDNVKARGINKLQNNSFVQLNSKKKIRSQFRTYEYFSENIRTNET